jgi:carbonic anhydrase/acetyltransferase-like protein (isoleucine patch superfamily)
MIRRFNGKTPKIADSAFISEAAYVVGDVEIGENTSVWPGAVIRGDFGKITIGEGSVIEDNCVIHSGSPASPNSGDVTIGNNVVMGHGAVSNCRKIGNNVLIGMNATLLHDAEIGNYCIVAAGCLVKEKMMIPDGYLVAGVPGKIKGEVSSKQKWWVTESPAGYSILSKQYKLEGL